MESQSKDWEQELFLQERDLAEIRAKQMVQVILDGLEAEVMQEGPTQIQTAEALLSRLRRETETTRSAVRVTTMASVGHRMHAASRVRVCGEA